MKRKFISALLFGALITASTSTFVSCKDYDDDITELRDQIASNATDLTSLVDEKVSNADAQIAELKKQAAELETAYKLADEGLQASIDDAKNYADIQAEEARKAAVESARTMVDEAVSALQQGIDAANTAIAEQGKTVAGLLEADQKLQAGINAAQARADEAYTLAEQAKSLGEANATKIEALNTTLEAISASMLEVKNNLEAQISVINGNVADLQKKAESQAASIQSLETQLKSLKESNDKALEALGAKDAELAQQIKDNNDAITNRLNTEVADLKKLAADNLAEAKAYTDALKQWVEDQISGINTSISNLETAYKEADEVLDKKIDKLRTDLEKKISDLKTDQSTTDGAQDKRIEAIENTLKALENGNLTQFAEKVSTMEGNITTLQTDVQAINANIAIETKRLKGLVFAPTTYVDGIECIKFATLKYRDWGTDPTKWEADAAASTNKLYIIDDARHTEEYLVNPKNADVKDIVALEFISNTATNYTRAVSANAPIAVADKMEDVKIVNGVMKLNLKKTTTESFGTGHGKFTIVALKATLSDALLTEQEKADGVKAEVYSDWARLYETSSWACIHNKLATDKAGKLLENAEQTIDIPATGDGDAVSETENYSHFWSFSEAYAKGTKKDNLGRDHNYRHIAKRVYYKDKLDLYDLVEVCDKDGSTYDAGKYGLGFFFDLIDYNLMNDNETSDVTNQKNFGKLDADGHTLYSTARDNTTTENRDAIGKAPMVQVVLKDTSDINNVKVVDVRYFKILWVDKDETVTYEPGLGNFTDEYKCSEDVSQLVLEETVNAIYTWTNMTRSEFHNSYELNTTLFATKDAAAKGTPDVATLGTITDQADWADPGQTHNLKWTISTTYNAATQKEYEDGKKTIEAWGYFVSKTNPNSKILFRLSLTLNIKKMALAEGMGKDQTMWKDGARYINPQLHTDAVYGTVGGYATTMLLGDLLKGYIKDGQTPADVTSLVNFGDAKFVFDESKFDALPKGDDPKPGDWSTGNNAMSLIYKGEVAAIIGTDGTIKLTESNNGQEESIPTEGAKLLVGHSVPVKLVDTWCSLSDDIEGYNVNFIEPLKSDHPTVKVSVDDIKNGGSVSTSFEKEIVIMENFGKNSEKVYENGGESNTTLMSWYGVDEPVYDIDNAKTNIQKDGTIGGKIETSLADIKNSDGKMKYKVDVKDNTVIFYNMSGNAIGRQFQILIPVVITTKWQVITAYLEVTVNPSI